MKFHLRDLFWLVLVAAFCSLWLRDRMRLNELAEEQARAAANERQAIQFMYQLQTQNFGPTTPKQVPLLTTDGAGDSAENSGAILSPNPPRESEEPADNLRRDSGESGPAKSP